jgi:CRP-like cAMP-binding protein
MTSGVAEGRAAPIPFLFRLQPHVRDELVIAGTVKSVVEGAEIYAQDRRSAKIVILLDVYTAVLRRRREGEKWIAYRGPGDVLGELSLIDGLPHSATVRAVRGGEIVVLSYKGFAQVMRRHESVRAALLRTVVDRLRTSDRLRDLGQEPVLVRVLRLLDERGHAPGSAHPRGAPPRFQHEIAEMLGVARSSVVRALAVVRDRGLVTTRRGLIQVEDSAGLKRFLDELARRPLSGESGLSRPSEDRTERPFGDDGSE